MTDDKIWIGQNGQKYGPYSEADIRHWQAEGKFAPDAVAWRNGMADWVPLASMLAAAETGSSQPPPLSAAAPASGGSPAFADTLGVTTIPTPLSARRPDTYDAAAQDRATLPSPPSLHWGLVLLLAVLTFGIFAIIWPFIQANWVRKIDQQSKAPLLVSLALVCAVIGYPIYFSGIVSATHGGSMGMAPLGGLLLLACWILYLTAYFSMAGSMRRNLSAYGLPVEIGGVTLFFFTMYYLQGQLSWVARWKNTGHTLPRASKGIFWAIFCILPFVVSILAAIAIPAYQDYIIRSQVSEGVVLADGAKLAVAEAYASSGHLPADNPAAGLAENTNMSSPHVSSVEVSDGKVVVAFDTAGANLQIRHDVLVLTPQPDSNGSLEWRCGGPETTVPEKYLPVTCRQ